MGTCRGVTSNLGLPSLPDSGLAPIVTALQVSYAILDNTSCNILESDLKQPFGVALKISIHAL